MAKSKTPTKKPSSKATLVSPKKAKSSSVDKASLQESTKAAAKKNPRAKTPEPATHRRAEPATHRLVKAELVDGDAQTLASTNEADSADDFDPILNVSPSQLPARSAPGSAERSVTVSDPVALYLKEVRKYQLLTREEEQALAKKYYDTKDPAAAQALVTSNLRFVVKVAVEYSKFGARLIDLIQEGNMGLMHAVREFNPYKGNRLITYAVWWIRGYIQEYLMKQYSLVKIGTTQNQKKLFYRLQKEKEALDSLGESADFAMIGTRLGIPANEVEEMSQRIRGRDVSLSQPLDADSGTSLMDFQKSSAANPDELLAAEEEVQILKDKIEILRPQLNEREKILLEERLLSEDPLTLQEIGEKYGITREAVRQAEARLMKKIKELILPAITVGLEAKKTDS